MTKKSNQPKQTQKLDNLTKNLRANLIRRKKAKKIISTVNNVISDAQKED